MWNNVFITGMPNEMTLDENVTNEPVTIDWLTKAKAMLA